MSVTASLRALLTGAIDYAGLFPPASLALEPAWRNYVRYRQEPESWLLGRFICPVAKLAEVAVFPERQHPGVPFAFSVLGSGGSTAEAFARNLPNDVTAINLFRQQQREHAVVDRFEVQLPAGGLDAVKSLETVAANLGLPYLEAPAAANWRAMVRAIITALAQGKPCPAGFKLRCGGTQVAAFPTAEQVAFALAACRDADLPIKFTAGLHHPLRHTDAGLQTKMHGFINIYVAGVLAHARRLTEEQLVPILADEDGQSFGFDDDGLRWHDHRASVAEIERVRQAVTSFGSCSFDEPREDLRQLGWL